MGLSGNGGLGVVVSVLVLVVVQNKFISSNRDRSPFWFVVVVVVLVG